MDYFQTTKGRVFGLGLGLCLGALIEPPHDALDARYEQSLATTYDVPAKVSGPKRVLPVPSFDNAQLTPFIFGDGLHCAADDVLDQLTPGPGKPGLPERGVIYSLRKVLARVGPLSVAWLMSPSWLRTYGLGFVSSALPGNLFRIVHWCLLLSRGTASGSLFSHVYPFDFTPKLSYLYRWRPPGGALPRLGYLSAILLRCMGNANFDRRLLLYIDIHMTPCIITFATYGVLTGAGYLFSPADGYRHFAMQGFYLFTRRFLMDLAAGGLEAVASWWLESKLLDH